MKKRFFIGCNLGFEEELCKEVSEVWPFLIEVDGGLNSQSLEIQTDQGGVEIEADFHVGLQINFFLKLANRVLLRVAQKKICDFPALFNWIEKQKKDPLLQQFSKDTVFDFEVAASQSRLNNEKRVIEILQKHFRTGPDVTQKIYLRIHEDEVTLSLDTSGDLLHKRNQKDVGIAPLRETLAAFCLRKMIGDLSPQDLQKINLLDPMCGSGTFLMEAARLYRPTQSRRWSFLNWPQCPKIFHSATFLANTFVFPRIFDQLRGQDLNAEVIEIAQRSLRSEGSLDPKILFQVRDLFSDIESEKVEKFRSPVWVVSNIPYGERIKEVHSPHEIIQRIQKLWKPEKIGLLMSDRQVESLPAEDRNQIRARCRFKNGGLPVSFVIWESRSSTRE